MERNQATQDHDLLIELRTEMRGMREDIKSLSDGMSAKISDHEMRIRGIEKTTDNLMAKMVFGISIFSFVMAVLSALVVGWLKKGFGI